MGIDLRLRKVRFGLVVPAVSAFVHCRRELDAASRIDRLNSRVATGHRWIVKIVTVAKSMMQGVGSAPLLYLMIALSIVSTAIMLERAWLFATMRADLDALLRDLTAYLSVRDFVGA